MTISTFVPVHLTGENRLVMPDRVGYHVSETRSFGKRYPVHQGAIIGEMPVPKEFLRYGMVPLHEHLRSCEEPPYRFIVGMHETCEGLFELIRTSASTKVLLCGHCHLHIEFPATIETYEKLGEHFSPQLRFYFPPTYA